jgi:hypothetical protein
MDTRMNILLSYAYQKDFPVSVINANAGSFNILLDSGAFTAYKSKREINFKEYCAFVKNPPFKIWRYFALDKIGDDLITKRNLDSMLSKGLNPVPVFQRGQSLDVLYRLQETFSLIGIGGLASARCDADAKSYLKFILERKDIDKKKLHILGLKNLDFLRLYRPYSADTSEVLRSFQFGEITYFNKATNSLGRIKRRDAMRHKYILSLANSHPNIFESLLTEDGWKSGSRPGNNAHFLASLVSLKQVTKDLQAIGCKLFLSYPNSVPLETLL